MEAFNGQCEILLCPVEAPCGMRVPQEEAGQTSEPPREAVCLQSFKIHSGLHGETKELMKCGGFVTKGHCAYFNDRDAICFSFSVQKEYENGARCRVQPCAQAGAGFWVDKSSFSCSITLQVGAVL